MTEESRMPPPDSALSRLGAYLTENLYEDQWTDCEALLLEATSEMAAANDRFDQCTELLTETRDSKRLREAEVERLRDMVADSEKTVSALRAELAMARRVERERCLHVCDLVVARYASDGPVTAEYCRDGIRALSDASGEGE